MMWTLPRSNPGADETFFRPDATGVSAPAGKLPYGPLPRVLMLWLYADCVRSAEHPQTPLQHQYAFADYLLELRFEHPATPELAEQADRLLACRFHFGDTVIPVTRGATLGAIDGAGRALPALEQIGTGEVDLSEELRREMAHRPLKLCTHTLCAVQHCAFTLDVYLWDRCYRRCAAHGAPPPRSRLARYQALAEHPEPWPSHEALCAFEDDLTKAREHLKRLWRETHPFEHDLPF